MGAEQAATLLGSSFDLLTLPAGLVTRPRSSSSKSQVIDHIAVLGGKAAKGETADVAGASDHNLVRARILLDR
jgi:hypothetical protein